MYSIFFTFSVGSMSVGFVCFQDSLLNVCLTDLHENFERAFFARIIQFEVNTCFYEEWVGSFSRVNYSCRVYKRFSCATKAGRKSDLYLRNDRGDPSLSWITPQLFIDTRHDSKTLIWARGTMMNRLRQNHLDPLTPRVKEPAY